MIPERSERVDGAGGDELVLTRARARAKKAWVTAQQDDDLTRRAASEERLIAAWPRPRRLPVRSFLLGAAAAAFVATLGFVGLRSMGGASTAPLAAPPTARGPSAAPGATSASTSTIALLPSPSPSPAARGVVFAAACPGCRIGGAAVEPGVPLATGRTVSVPRGAGLTLGFALPGALVDPAVGVDLEGPAAASTPDEHTIVLERGSARCRGLRDVTVSAAGVGVVGAGATFTVSIAGSGVVRVEVEKGRVVVRSLTTSDSRTLEAGAAIEVPPARAPSDTTAAAPGGAAAAAAPPAEATEAFDAVAHARTLFHDGDKEAARSQLEALVHSQDVNVARRASFTLAELEMAIGERDRGRARLGELATCPDARLAADATTLLARTEPTARGRAEIWARYLATSPPSGYRERALLERAEALLDSGQRQDANAILVELRMIRLSDAQGRQLERLLGKTRSLR